MRFTLIFSILATYKRNPYHSSNSNKLKTNHYHTSTWGIGASWSRLFLLYPWQLYSIHLKPTANQKTTWSPIAVWEKRMVWNLSAGIVKLQKLPKIGLIKGKIANWYTTTLRMVKTWHMVQTLVAYGRLSCGSMRDMTMSTRQTSVWIISHVGITCNWFGAPPEKLDVEGLNVTRGTTTWLFAIMTLQGTTKDRGLINSLLIACHVLLLFVFWSNFVTKATLSMRCCVIRSLRVDEWNLIGIDAINKLREWNFICFGHNLFVFFLGFRNRISQLLVITKPLIKHLYRSFY